jgi:Protein of unknown function (DUF2501)
MIKLKLGDTNLTDRWTFDRVKRYRVALKLSVWRQPQIRKDVQHAQPDEGALAIAVLALTHGAAQAQLMDQLKGAAGNTAGVLDYCIKNKYLGSGSASSVKDSLLGKVTGQSNDSGYREGSNGMLQTGNGQGCSLGGDGIKAQNTQKVCDQVLQYAKSFLW